MPRLRTLRSAQPRFVVALLAIGLFSFLVTFVVLVGRDNVSLKKQVEILEQKVRTTCVPENEKTKAILVVNKQGGVTCSIVPMQFRTM